jgi:recombination DNA repair RAD52 pathway protein
MQEVELTDEQRDAVSEVLRKAFDKSVIQQRVGGGGKKLDYIEGHVINLRLIEATRNNFSFVITDEKEYDWGTSKQGEAQILHKVRGQLTIPGLGTREGTGVQIITVGKSEDLWKSAETDAMKKAASKFGVALHLYGDDYEGQAVAQANSKTIEDNLRDILRATLKVTTVGEVNAATQKEFGKRYGELTDAEKTAWTKKLQADQPVPF